MQRLIISCHRANLRRVLLTRQYNKFPEAKVVVGTDVYDELENLGQPGTPGTHDIRASSNLVYLRGKMSRS